MPSVDPQDGFTQRALLPSGKYTGLREEESRVLKQYVTENDPDSIERLRTAVPVGDGEVPGEPEDNFERQVKLLSQFKIDAVVDRPGQQEIVELKSRATHTAVGQVLAYDLYLGQRATEPTNSRPVVAAFRAHPDLPQFARAVGVELHTVPDADPSGATERFLRDREQFGAFDGDTS